MKKIILTLFCLITFQNTFSQSPKNLALLGSLQFPGQRLSGCWHYNNLAGKEYALIGAENGIVIADVSIPSNPIQLFQLPGNTSIWHEVKVQGDFAYAVSEGSDVNGIKNGLQIIDLRFLPDSAPNKFYKGTDSIAGELVSAHSITNEGHYLFINGHNITRLGRGVIILDITNPLFPTYAGSITNRYCHDSFVRGDVIYTSDIYAGLFSVYNISNTFNPILLATQNTPGNFTHNTWLSDDGHILFTADEKSSTPIGAFDITDLNNITLIDTFFNGNFSQKEVHNVRVKNDFLINPSYGSQLTIADAARPANVIEIGNYETGDFLCWDADPFPNSGNIFATDMNSETFYVFSPTYLRACYLEGIVTDSLTGLPIVGAAVEITSVSISKATNFLGEYRTGYADSGSYNVTFSSANYTSKSFNVSLHNGNLTTLNVQLIPIGAGIQKLTDKDIKIYPNPAINEIYIESNELPVLNWRITDASGKLVLKNESGFSRSQQFNINIKSLSSGIYTVVLESPLRNFEKTIIKK